MSDHAVHFTSKTPEHYTPAAVLERVVATLGRIDLDPCSNSHTDPNVPAARHFTAEDDGLGQPWHGRIFMNPPYGREIQGWVAKLAQEYQAGHVTEGIALVPARTDTRWWQLLRDHPVCLVRGRLRFVGEGNTSAAPFPSAVFYLGGWPPRFLSAFEDLGDVWVRVLNYHEYGSEEPIACTTTAPRTSTPA